MTFAELVYTRIIPFIDGYVIQFLYVVAFFFFLFGIFRFFFTGGEENRERGKKFAVWGLVGLVVLFSVWSLVRILLTTVFDTAGGPGTPGAGQGTVPRGGQCDDSSDCRSHICTLRGANTSTCE